MVFCFVLKGQGSEIWSFLASAPFVFFCAWIVCSGRRVEVSLGKLFWCKPMIEMIQSWETYAAWHPKYRILLLMEGILHHLGCIKPCKSWDKLPINWCRILSINSMIVDKWNFCRSCTLCNVVLVVRYSVCVCVTFTYTLTLAVWPFPIPDPPPIWLPHCSMTGWMSLELFRMPSGMGFLPFTSKHLKCGHKIRPNQVSSRDFGTSGEGEVWYPEIFRSRTTIFSFWVLGSKNSGGESPQSQEK